MSNVAIMPVQWSSIEDIHDIEPIGASDEECLKEISRVLKKYGQQNRIGIALLHKHFDLSDDEIMLEVTDFDGRQLITEPASSDVAGNGNIGTIFALRDGDDFESMSHCHQFCKRGIFGNHFGSHRKMK